MAERRIVEMNRPGQGIISFISNYSWLDGLSFTGMRERYLEVFDSIRIDCLNGDQYKTGKLTPEGDSDPSAFSTEYNREGIQVGTAIALLVKGGNAAMDLGRLKAVQQAETDPRAALPRYVVPASAGNAAMVGSDRRADLSSRHFWGKTNAPTSSPTKAHIRDSHPLLKSAIPSCPITSSGTVTGRSTRAGSISPKPPPDRGADFDAGGAGREL